MSCLQASPRARTHHFLELPVEDACLVCICVLHSLLLLCLGIYCRRWDVSIVAHGSCSTCTLLYLFIARRPCARPMRGAHRQATIQCLHARSVDSFGIWHLRSILRPGLRAAYYICHSSISFVSHICPSFPTWTGTQCSLRSSDIPRLGMFAVSVDFVCSMHVVLATVLI